MKVKIEAGEFSMQTHVDSYGKIPAVARLFLEQIRDAQKGSEEDDDE